MTVPDVASDPALPRPSGLLTEALFRYLTGDADTLNPVLPVAANPLEDDDFQLALYCCYELHYRGFSGVSSEMEWDLRVLRFRQHLELSFERALLALVPLPVDTHAAEVRAAIDQEIAAAPGPSLSEHLLRSDDRREFCEFLIHRSAYQRKEADPHSWAIPRFDGPSRAALVEIQADEYGNGVPGAAHADLFATTMEELGLDPTYGAYLDVLPGTTLATTNLISWFGLHRRLLPALLGHLAVFEMTSVGPMGRYGEVVDHHHAGAEARRFYDVHVEADAHHGPLASSVLVGEYLARRPADAALVLWGAQTLMAVEHHFTLQLIDCWTRGRSSLRAVGALQLAG